MSDFDYSKAQKWLTGWVATVDHPELTWAWDAVVGVIDHYAVISVSEGETLHAKRAELWSDWFAAWEGGDAHYGVHGVMQEFAHACPEEAVSDQLLAIGEAYDFATGKGGTQRRPSRSKMPPPPAPAVRLVVDNTTKRKP